MSFTHNFVGWQLTRNTYLGTMKLSKIFSIAFDLRPKGTVTKGNADILHMATSDKNCCSKGDRLPDVLFKRGTTKLIVCMDMEAPNRCYYAKDNVPVNKFTSVLIKQEEKDGKYFFTITVAGKEEFKRENKKPQDFNGVKIWASDRFKYSANAEMRNLEIRNLGTFTL